MNTVFMKRWMKNQVNQFDVIIVEGAAGMMAAGTAAQNGLRTLLLEKNSRLGRKIAHYGQRKMQYCK